MNLDRMNLDQNLTQVPRTTFLYEFINRTKNAVITHWQ